MDEIQDFSRMRLFTNRTNRRIPAPYESQDPAPFIAEGYNDPTCSVIGGVSTDLASADWTTWTCNRAGLMIGAGLCVKAMANPVTLRWKSNLRGERKLIGTALRQVENAATRTISRTIKKEAQAIGQKTARVAKEYLGKDAVNLSPSSVAAEGR